MLTQSAQYKLMKALKFPDAEIEAAMNGGEHDVDIPKVFIHTPEELRSLKKQWLRRGKMALEVAA